MIIKQGVNVIAAGIVPKDAEFKLVGTKSSAMCRFSIKVGEDTIKNAIWQTCVCWRGLAERVKGVQKGDNVTVFGTLQSREYNENIYTDLVCDDVILSALASFTEAPKPAQKPVPKAAPMPDMQEVIEDDLPF